MRHGITLEELAIFIVMAIVVVIGFVQDSKLDAMQDKPPYKIMRVHPASN